MRTGSGAFPEREIFPDSAFLKNGLARTCVRHRKSGRVRHSGSRGLCSRKCLRQSEIDPPCKIQTPVLRLYVTPKYRSFPPQKKEITPIGKTPNPGILRALISASLQNGLRLGVNDPLFDRKLLDYLHVQGVGITSDKGRNRAVSLFREIHYFEPHTGSDCHFPDPVFGFFGSGAHRYREYCFKQFFLQNNPFNRDLNLQFSGLLRASFLGTELLEFF